MLYHYVRLWRMKYSEITDSCIYTFKCRFSDIDTMHSAIKRAIIVVISIILFVDVVVFLYMLLLILSLFSDIIAVKTISVMYGDSVYHYYCS